MRGEGIGEVGRWMRRREQGKGGGRGKEVARGRRRRRPPYSAAASLSLSSELERVINAMCPEQWTTSRPRGCSGQAVRDFLEVGVDHSSQERRDASTGSSAGVFGRGGGWRAWTFGGTTASLLAATHVTALR